MNAAEHKARAEKLLSPREVRDSYGEYYLKDPSDRDIALAQVHATLATIPDSEEG